MHLIPRPVPIHRVLEGIRDARFSRGLRCPHCTGDRIHRWGRFAGRQRYRCCRCGRTFSDLTGTPSAYIKKLSQFALSAGSLMEAHTVRRTARDLGVAPSTAFRWRHRLLADLASRRPRRPLRGWIECSVTRFVESQKGNRHLDRPARRRGLAPGGPTLFAHRVLVLLACDRLGAVDSIALPSSHRSVRPAGVGALLADRSTHLVAVSSREGPLGPFARWARGAALDHRPLYPRRSGPSLSHLRTVTAYTRRLIQWLRRFRGVATRYLPHYLAWHREQDARERIAFDATLLQWPMEEPIPGR